jgi:hypothetical protein
LTGALPPSAQPLSEPFGFFGNHTSKFDLKTSHGPKLLARGCGWRSLFNSARVTFRFLAMEASFFG